MSISAIIPNPKNKSEALLNIPIASEKFFEENWIPAIKALCLKWTICFQSGIEITKDDLHSVYAELEKIRPWVSENLSSENATFMITRIDDLINNLQQLFKDETIIVYIG